MHEGPDSPPREIATAEVAAEAGDVDLDRARGHLAIGAIEVPCTGKSLGAGGGDRAELPAADAEGLGEPVGDRGDLQVEVRADRISGRVAGGAVARLFHLLVIAARGCGALARLRGGVQAGVAAEARAGEDVEERAQGRDPWKTSDPGAREGAVVDQGVLPAGVDQLAHPASSPVPPPRGPVLEPRADGIARSPERHRLFEMRLEEAAGVGGEGGLGEGQPRTGGGAASHAQDLLVPKSGEGGGEHRRLRGEEKEVGGHQERHAHAADPPADFQKRSGRGADHACQRLRQGGEGDERRADHGDGLAQGLLRSVADASRGLEQGGERSQAADQAEHDGVGGEELEDGHVVGDLGAVGVGVEVEGARLLRRQGVGGVVRGVLQADLFVEGAAQAGDREDGEGDDQHEQGAEDQGLSVFLLRETSDRRKDHGSPYQARQAAPQPLP